RLVIKRIHLARASVHEELHDAFDLGAMMNATVPLGPRFGPQAVRQQFVASQQMSQRDAAQPAAEAPKEFAARQATEMCRIRLQMGSLAIRPDWRKPVFGARPSGRFRVRKSQPKRKPSGVPNAEAA